MGSDEWILTHGVLVAREYLFLACRLCYDFVNNVNVSISVQAYNVIILIGLHFGYENFPVRIPLLMFLAT